MFINSFTTDLWYFEVGNGSLHKSACRLTDAGVLKWLADSDRTSDHPAHKNPEPNLTTTPTSHIKNWTVSQWFEEVKLKSSIWLKLLVAKLHAKDQKPASWHQKNLECNSYVEKQQKVCPFRTINKPFNLTTSSWSDLTLKICLVFQFLSIFVIRKYSN